MIMNIVAVGLMVPSGIVTLFLIAYTIHCLIDSHRTHKALIDKYDAPNNQDVPEIDTLILAYRSYGFAAGELVGSRWPWPEALKQARCDFSPSNDKNPKTAEKHLSSGRCECGIYAMKEIKKVPQNPVIASVILWGWVVPAEEGYRAQYAEIQEMWLVPKLCGPYMEVYRSQLEKKYGVPVGTMEDPWHQDTAFHYKAAMGVYDSTAYGSTLTYPTMTYPSRYPTTVTFDGQSLSPVHDGLYGCPCQLCQPMLLEDKE